MHKRRPPLSLFHKKKPTDTGLEWLDVSLLQCFLNVIFDGLLGPLAFAVLKTILNSWYFTGMCIRMFNSGLAIEVLVAKHGYRPTGLSIG